MTRYQKELRKRGYKTNDNDCPWLPYDMDYVTLEGISTFIKDNRITICRVFTSFVEYEVFDKNFNSDVYYE